MKTIDLDKTVHELCSADPDLAPILASLGFTEIVKPMMLSTVGKFMTIPKGAVMRNIKMETIREKLEANGYEILHSSKEI
jgi:hypothetical protein